MNARRPTNGRHRSSPPGRQALNNLAMATHLEVENQLLKDRIAELEARVAALTNARDELYASSLSAMVQCESIGPAPERFRCGLPEGHDGDHTVLTPSGVCHRCAPHVKETP